MMRWRRAANARGNADRAVPALGVALGHVSDMAGTIAL
jgi:hypothetical protein